MPRLHEREFERERDVVDRSCARDGRRGLDLAKRIDVSTSRSTVAIGLMLLASEVVAQRADTDALAIATTFRCAFRLVATGGWKDGAAEADVKSTDLTVVFTSVNTDEGTAESIGRFGRSEIIAKLSVSTIHFMQSFKDGPLYVTTVFGGQSRPGRLKAVHTRHEYADVQLPGFTSSPEQYYGECAVE